MRNFGDETADLLIKYTGSDIEIDGEKIVSQGETYDVIIPRLIDTIKEMKEEKVSIGCLQDGTCGNCDAEQKPSEAIVSIIQKLCGVGVNDIIYNAEGRSSIYNAAQFGGKSFSFSGVPSETNYTYAYDASQYTSIPGFAYLSVKTFIGDQLHRGSKNVTDSFSIPFSSFPFSVDVEITISGEDGDFILSGAHTIGTASAVDSSIELNLRDGRGNAKYTTLSGWMTDIEVKLDQMAAFMASLKAMTDSNLTGTGIQQLISSCGANSATNKDSISGLNNVTFNACDGCDQSTNGTIQDALNCLQGQVSKNTTDIAGS